MMPISDSPGYETGHFNRVYEHLFQPAIESAGFACERADDVAKTDYIVVGIVKKIIEADMVLCDLSGRNPNVLYELGLRHAYQKKVTLVKDKVSDKIFDVQGLRYTEYDSSLRVDSVLKDITKISESLIKTSQVNGNDVNSIVQLAGITAAEPPEGKRVSSDTAMLLNAIDSLKEQIFPVAIDQMEGNFVRLGTQAIKVRDGQIRVGEDIYLKNGKILGRLQSIHKNRDTCLVLLPDGNSLIFNATDSATDGWSSIPF